MTQPPPGRDRRPARCTASPPPCHDRARPRTKKPGTACPSRDKDGDLTDEDREWARRTVASLPPLTDRQRDILALLLRRHR
jgi:hypothetical protein